MILNQSKFSQAVNLSRAGVTKAVKNGSLVLDENGKINTEDKVNKVYIYSDAKKKSAFFRYKKKNESSEPTPKKVAKTTSTPKKVVENSGNEVDSQKRSIPKVTIHDSESSISIDNVAEQKMIVSLKIEQEKYIKHSLDNLEKVNKLANRDTLQFITERFINHFITSVKRVSSTSLADVSKDILANGKAENKHYAHFEDACLEMVHDAKMMLIKDMRRAEI